MPVEERKHDTAFFDKETIHIHLQYHSEKDKARAWELLGEKKLYPIYEVAIVFLKLRNQ